MKGKIVLEEHLSTALNNSLWDAGSEAARNGKACMDDVESRLLDVDRHFHTAGLHSAIAEIGTDRVMFSVDYPYESMAMASEWFDNATIAENDRERNGRGNALCLFKL
jgi:hypothetical protein